MSTDPKKIILLSLVFLAAFIAVAVSFNPLPHHAGKEVLIAGTDDPQGGEKIVVNCHYQPATNAPQKHKYKEHPHWAFITRDQNHNGRFDDDTSEPLAGFDVNDEVTIETYSGNDEVWVRCANDDLTHWLVINTGDGDDKVFGGETNEWIYGGGGMDVLFGNCKEGCESLRTCKDQEGIAPPFMKSSSPQRDLIVAGSDEPVKVISHDGKGFTDQYPQRDDKVEEIYCADNALCAVIGSDRDDCIRGSLHQTTMVYAQSGDDDIQTFDGDDIVHAGSGTDWVQLGTGDDQAYGGSGDDYLVGEEGTNQLDGGSGENTVIGGADHNNGLKAKKLKANHLTDWIGLPHYRIIGTKKIPKGFTDTQQFKTFGTELKNILARLKISDAKIIIMGSSVNGIASMGKPFRYAGPDKSDLDISIHSQTLIDSLRKFRIDAVGHVKKTAIYEVYPEIKGLSQNWATTLGRNVSIYALPPKVHRWRNMIVVE